jgi:hypothetical protein
MKFLLSHLLTLCLLLGFQPSYATTVPVTSEESAAAIADAAFQKHTKHKITDYSVHPGKHTRTDWHFFVIGEKSFLRPGNHWDIAVNRTTGDTKIVDGL